MKKLSMIQEFLLRNKCDYSTSIIWFKLDNIQHILNAVGLYGIKTLSETILKNIPLKPHEFDLKLQLTDEVFILGSRNLDRKNAITFAKNLLKWFEKNNMLVNDKYLFIKIKIVILANIPDRNHIENIIQKGELLLFCPYTQSNLVLLGESKEDEYDHYIKDLLIKSIQKKSYFYQYQKIISTSDIHNSHYLLKLEIPDTHENTISRNEYYSIAKESGILKQLNILSLSHTIKKTILNKNKSKVDTILLNQNISDFIHNGKLSDRIDKLKKYNIPKNRIYFKLYLDELTEHMGFLNECSIQLQQANISICLSGFDCSKVAWKVARMINAKWIELKPMKGLSPTFYENNLFKISKTIKKAHIFGYEVLVSRVDCNFFAADLWKLKVNLLQGNFTKVSDKNICKRLSKAS